MIEKVLLTSWITSSANFPIVLQVLFQFIPIICLWLAALAGFVVLIYLWLSLFVDLFRMGPSIMAISLCLLIDNWTECHALRNSLVLLELPRLILSKFLQLNYCLWLFLFINIRITYDLTSSLIYVYVNIDKEGGILFTHYFSWLI